MLVKFEEQNFVYSATSYKKFFTIVTPCSDKTVLTTTRTLACDMVTWFIVYTMTATMFSTVQSKLSR